MFCESFVSYTKYIEKLFLFQKAKSRMVKLVLRTLEELVFLSSQREKGHIRFQGATIRGSVNAARCGFAFIHPIWGHKGS